jgi:hypothetical protein
MSDTPDRAGRPAWRFLAAAVAFLRWTNAHLYGSAFQLGDGAVSGLFAPAIVPINLGHYPRWLRETHTPLQLRGVLAPLLASIGCQSPGAPAPVHGWLGLAFVTLVLACHLPYSPFEEWKYMRFLLPAIPVLLLTPTPVLVRLTSTAPAPARTSCSRPGRRPSPGTGLRDPAPWASSTGRRWPESADGRESRSVTRGTASDSSPENTWRRFETPAPIADHVETCLARG